LTEVNNVLGQLFTKKYTYAEIFVKSVRKKYV